MKLMRNGNVPTNGKRFATRAMVNAWNAKSEEDSEPGAPIWLYYELPNNPAGIAINTNEPHEAILEFIEKNVELENFFKSSTETKAERRAIWYVIPESWKPLMTEDHAPVITREGENDYVDSAWFKIIAPTKGGVLLVLLQKLLIAMLGEDEEAVLKARESFAATLGTNVGNLKVDEVEPTLVHSETDPDKMEDKQWYANQPKSGDDIPTGEVEHIDPVPKSIKTPEDFAGYVMQQIDRLTADEISFIVEKGTKHVAAKYHTADGVLDIQKLPDAITATNASKFATAFRKIIKDREDEAAQDSATHSVTPDVARKYIAEELTDGRTQRVEAILVDNGIAEETSVEDIPDEKALQIYAILFALPKAEETTPPKEDATGQQNLVS